MKDIQKYVYAKGKGEIEDKSRIGSIYHTRGIVAGIVTVEAIRPRRPSSARASRSPASRCAGASST